MKYRALLCLATLSIIGTLLTGCSRTPRPPVDSARHLQELVLVNEGQTLDDVRDLMTDELKERITIYPASSIEKKASGNWSFKAFEGGSIGDTDAPYVAVVIKPDPDNAKYLAIFLEDGEVFAVEWFASAATAIIHKVLGNLLDLGGTEESE